MPAPTNHPGFFVQRVAGKAPEATVPFGTEPNGNTASGVLGGEPLEGFGFGAPF